MRVWKLIANGAPGLHYSWCARRVVGARTATRSESQSPVEKRVLLLRGSTEVQLKLAQDVNSRASKPDEPVELSLAEDLIVDSQIVARAGSRAMGTVLHAKKPDFW